MKSLTLNFLTNLIVLVSILSLISLYAPLIVLLNENDPNYELILRNMTLEGF